MVVFITVGWVSTYLILDGKKNKRLRKIFIQNFVTILYVCYLKLEIVYE